MNHRYSPNLPITPHYEDDEMLPNIAEMQCPIKGYIDCEHWFDRNELGAHLGFYHKDYDEDPEPYFEDERGRQFK